MLCLWLFWQVVDSAVQFQKSPNIKSRGAYYTDFHWARWLSKWAIRSTTDKVLDPSFGGGVFLASSLQAFEALGVKVSQEQVIGVEIDPETFHQTSTYFAANQCQNPKLVCADFFKLEPTDLSQVSAIVGNPPFVRSQVQSSSQKLLIQKRALEQGVNLSKLANTWLPFVLHSCRFLKPGGRLALIVPFEIGQASYAKPLLNFLAERFETTHLITFQNPLFEDISQEVIFLLAENYGTSGKFYLTDVGSEPLDSIDLSKAQPFESQLFVKRGFPFFWLKPSLRAAYEALKLHPDIYCLNELSQVKNGYVTGANSFFHLSQQQVNDWGIKANHLKKTVYRGGSFKGLRFTKNDWLDAEQEGMAGYVLDAPVLTKNAVLTSYLNHGQTRRIHLGYKCRNRTPWYRLHNLSAADAYLSYMSGERVKLVQNGIAATAPNSLHHLKLKQGTDSELLCLLWQSSVTQLSVELEGHSLGGGMLKLEPSEAGRILIAKKPQDTKTLFPKMDRLIRQGQLADAQALADSLIRRDFSKELLEEFQEAALFLRTRRRKLKNSTSFLSDG